MKLALDEMYSRVVAEQLRARGHDVVAVTEHPEMRGAEDADVFSWAQEHGRALVTDNVADYIPIHHSHLADGRAHAGLVLTSNRRFPRGQPASIGALVEGLETLLSESGSSDEPAPSFLRWLQ